ncbi:hypothetical protein GUJ93_ZPchr0007g5612 [Zizania palustris]|uniref:Uncharacterized protein n=1 Tax=Zizania palustris TaxID=103762 RepID=A0A8J5T1G6_ZIZPA|nr:hypothetical protein GUJ93_ZPchr0007g5612 [Zizania palustris]
MAAQGGEAAAGSGAKPAVSTGMEQPSPSPYQPSASDHHLWSSSTGASWNYSMDNSNQNTVYYDPQRDVTVSGSAENVTSSTPHVVQSTMGTTNTTDSYAPYSNSVQPGYSTTQYPNYYYNYPPTANESSVQQGVDQNSDCARICYQQPLLSKQCLDCGASDIKAANISSGYVYPSTQPPPPGTTPWKSDAGTPAAPPPQPPGTPAFQNQQANQAAAPPGYQNQYVNPTLGTPGFQNQYANQAPTYQSATTYYSQLPLSNQADQQKALSWQDAHRLNKIQIPTNPRIAPSFPIAMPKAEERNSESGLSQKPAYVSVAMQKNDVKTAQDGHETVTQGSIPVSLRTYVGRNVSRCKDDAQRSAVQSILKEV